MRDTVNQLHLVVERRQFWHVVFVIGWVTTAIIWVPLLVLLLANGRTAAATTMTILAAVAAGLAYRTVRHRRQTSTTTQSAVLDTGKHLRSPGFAPETSRKGARHSVVFLAGFTAPLCLFVVYLLFAGPGAGSVMVVFGLPVLATAVAWFAHREWKRALLHRAGG